MIVHIHKGDGTAHATWSLAGIPVPIPIGMMASLSPMPFAFVLTVRTPEHYRLQGDSDNVAFTYGGKTVKISGAGRPLADSALVRFRAGGFDTEAEAAAFAEELRGHLRLASVAESFPINVGAFQADQTCHLSYASHTCS